MTEQSVGRPSVMTEEVLRILEDCFSVGATDVQACFKAGISKTALYDYQSDHPEFTERKEGLKSMTSYAAKVVVNNKILADADEDLSMWQLERTEKETYSTKSTVDNNHKGSINLVNDVPETKLDL